MHWTNIAIRNFLSGGSTMSIPNESERVAEVLRKHEEARREEAEAAGAYKQLLARLQSEHGCANVAEAEALLAELDGKIRELEPQLEELLTLMERDYSGR
jgi:hypothetical protein